MTAGMWWTVAVLVICTGVSVVNVVLSAVFARRAYQAARLSRQAATLALQGPQRPDVNAMSAELSARIHGDARTDGMPRSPGDLARRVQDNAPELFALHRLRAAEREAGVTPTIPPESASDFDTGQCPTHGIVPRTSATTADGDPACPYCRTSLIVQAPSDAPTGPLVLCGTCGVVALPLGADMSGEIRCPVCNRATLGDVPPSHLRP